MKKIILLAVALFASMALLAQSGARNQVNYYGVDFSRAKAFGASESGWEFKNAFIKINLLVINEWSKYDPGRLLGCEIVLRDIAPTAHANDEIDPEEVITTSSRFGINDEDIDEMVRGYELDESAGTGLVIVGVVCDKTLPAAGFVVVYFDIATREVLSTRSISGSARGFGLRNYWAGALYNALRRG
jgi:hypothetical protein